MKYTLLLVDDEALAIEGVKSDLDLPKLGISDLYTAYSSKRAMDIFQREPIDILICDIEMPRGNGLDLLRWVREHHPNTVTIFLTSHADFKYAKEALHLGSLEYLLKPVKANDLEDAIRKAQSAIDRNSEISRHSQSHQLWMKNHSLIIEHFWLNLINHSTAMRPAAIREQIEQHHIPITEQSVFIPVLIVVRRWNKPLKRSDEKILNYALKNTAEEILLGGRTNGISFHLDRGMVLVILTAGNEPYRFLDSLEETCRRYIEACNQYFYCDLNGYIGQPVQVHEMANMVADLRAQDHDNVAFVNKVQFHGAATNAERQPVLPNWPLLSSLLKSGAREAVVREVKSSMENLVNNRQLDAKILHQINQTFCQVLFSHLNGRGIQAHQLFGEDESRMLSSKAERSVADMLEWVEHAANKALKQTEAVQETDSVVQTVKRYIALNLDQEVTRETAAEQVFLHPDHLLRIFKRDTGYSVTEYILLERMKLAKELLTQTDLPISAVSSSVGYPNFSHFTRTFKKYAGIGPSEYRKQVHDRPAGDA